MAPGGAARASPRGRGPRSIAAAAGLIAALGLGGCVTLLPRSKPVQLYTFAPAAAPPGPAMAQRRGVQLQLASFTQPARTDRILTRSGRRVATIAGVRWVAPADVLFREALAAAFEGTPVWTLPQPGPGLAGALRVEVTAFEAQYPQAGGVPTVAVAVRATYRPQVGPAATKTFRTDVRAAANRVPLIVEAFANATQRIDQDLVGWTVEESR